MILCTRFTAHLVRVAVLASIMGTWAKAEPIGYALASLGSRDPSVAGYLNYLSPGDKAAFQSGSFDEWAHPTVEGNRDLGAVNVSVPVPGSSRDWWNLGTATSSNDLGLSVGTGYHIASPGAYVYEPGNYGGGHVIDPAIPSHATAINNQGVVIGSWLTWTYPPITGEQPTLWRTGETGSATVLDPLGRAGIALALNDATQVVGMFRSGKAEPLFGDEHAFVYDQGNFQDLNDLIPKASGIVLTQAVGIDDQGRIIAFGRSAQDPGPQVYLLTPTTVPEPSTLALASLLIAATAARRLRRSFP